MRVEALTHPDPIEPRACEWLSEKFDERPHTQRPDDFDKSGGVDGQDVEGVREMHQVVIALHGFPVEREAVLVVVAVTLFDEKRGFDSPAMPCSDVASFVDVTQRASPSPPTGWRA